VKKEKMEAKKGEGKGRWQKVVIGTLAAVVIAALFTVTIGVDMNNSDTGNSIAGKSDLKDTIIAYGEDGEATSSKDVMLHGVWTQQGGPFRVAGPNTQVIYEGTSGFFLTIEPNRASADFHVKYYVDGKEKTSRLFTGDQATTLSYDFGKGEHKRVVVRGASYLGADIAFGDYEIT
jgi:hypothetical protein